MLIAAKDMVVLTEMGVLMSIGTVVDTVADTATDVEVVEHGNDFDRLMKGEWVVEVGSMKVVGCIGRSEKVGFVEGGNVGLDVEHGEVAESIHSFVERDDGDVRFESVDMMAVQCVAVDVAGGADAVADEDGGKYHENEFAW